METIVMNANETIQISEICGVVFLFGFFRSEEVNLSLRNELN